MSAPDDEAVVLAGAVAHVASLRAAAGAHPSGAAPPVFDRFRCEHCGVEQIGPLNVLPPRWLRVATWRSDELGVPPWIFCDPSCAAVHLLAGQVR